MCGLKEILNDVLYETIVATLWNLSQPSAVLRGTEQGEVHPGAGDNGVFPNKQ